MGVECTGRNVEVTTPVEELARQRTQRLERHLGGAAQVQVVLSREKHRFGSEVRIVRGAQRSPVKPMSTEEAALRLEASRQEFLVFRNSTKEKISVLYRRRDGDFGLIVPEC